MNSLQIITASLIYASPFFIVHCNSKIQTVIHLTDQADSIQFYNYKIDLPDTLRHVNLAKAIKGYAAASRDTSLVMLPRDTVSLRFPWQLIIGFNKMFESKSFVFDKKNEQIIELKDLFSDTIAIKAIRQFVRNAVLFDNYKAFLPSAITSEGVTGIKIIFPPHQVAPYAAGMPAIFIPADQFYNYLAPEYKKVFIQNK